MKGSLERLITDKESRVIMDLVNRFRSPSQDHDSSSRENLITDTVVIPVGGWDRSKPLPALYDRNGFCWYEGDHENGVPNGQGKEYRDVNGKRVLLFQGTFKDGKKVKGNQFLNNWLFYTCEYRDGTLFASGWDDSTKKRIDKLIASSSNSQARDMTGTAPSILTASTTSRAPSRTVSPRAAN